VREELVENPLNRHVSDTNWALAGEPTVVKLVEWESGKVGKYEGRAVLCESGKVGRYEGRGPAYAGNPPQRLATSAIAPDWSTWDTRWRRHVLDTEGATLVLEGDVVRAEGIRRGQLFRTMRIEEGTVYQAKVNFRGRIGPSSNVFVRMDWYDEAGKQLSRSAIDRLPPGTYEEAITIGPVEKAPEGAAFARLFIRFYEMELGDVLFVD